jgi:peptidoglycan-associated lipoprotein
MRFQALTLLAAVSLLAACSTAPDASTTTGGTGTVAAPATGGVRAGSQQDLAATAGDRVYFAYDKSDISPEARAILTKQSDWLKKNANVTVTIEGHCDERGTREYNLALGARRANAVRDFLVSQGIQGGRITTVSYGKEKPIDPGSGEEADQHNRNGHTAIVSGARTR